VAHYVKNVWTDNVTPVDKSHMDVIEAGITEAADLYYLGDWVAGTYKEGDIVVYNGVAYVAVRQTTQTPVPWAAGQASLSYGTSLPSNPVDGQEAVLVDSVTAPAWQWRFRYNAGSANTDKWEFIGGAPAILNGPGPSTVSTGWYNVLAWAVPRAGLYLCTACADDIQPNASVAATVYTGPGSLARGSGIRLSRLLLPLGPAGNNQGAPPCTAADTVAAGGQIVLWMTAGSAVTLNSRTLIVQPVRVS